MKRISLSRLHIVMECPGSHRDDCEWTTEPDSYAARGGLGFHDGIETFHAEPDWAAIAARHKLTPRMVEMAQNQRAQALKWMDAGHYRPTWRAEVAIAYDPLTQATRELAPGDRTTLPGEWYGRYDVIDPSPESAFWGDWKSGRRPVGPPKEVPQAWGGAAITATHYKLDWIDAGIMQVAEYGVDASIQRMHKGQLVHARIEMMQIHTRAAALDAPYVAGSHCVYCPAKKTCATFAAAKNISKKEEPIMVAKPSIEHAPAANGNGRMTLKNVKTGVTAEPVRILIHALDKVGKSTFAAGAPSPVFIGMESGLSQLGPARYPEPACFDDVMAALEDLRASSHDFKTVVIDPVNWLERFVFDEVCKEAGKSNIDDVGGGFAKGQARAIKFWNHMIDALEALRTQRKMHVIITAHTAVRNQKNPEAQDWGSWQPAMDKVGAERLKQWVDAILFARLEEFAKTIDNKIKGRSTGHRVILTQSNAAYAAGNRYGLPEELPLSWAEFWAAMQVGQGTRDELAAKAREIATELGADVAAKLEAKISEYDVNKLVEIVNALSTKRDAKVA